MPHAFTLLVRDIRAFTASCGPPRVPSPRSNRGDPVVCANGTILGQETLPPAMGFRGLPEPNAASSAGYIADKLVKEAKRKPVQEHLKHVLLGGADLSNTQDFKCSPEMETPL